MRRIIAIVALFVISLALQAYIEPQETTISNSQHIRPLHNTNEDIDFVEDTPGFQPEYAKRTGKI